MYTPFVYYMAKNMVEIPAIMLTPFLTLLVIYWSVGYISFFKMYIIIFLVADTSISVGLFISGFAHDITTASTIAPLFTLPFILFGGFIANVSTEPAWLAWIQWISPIRFANEALAHSQYDSIEEGFA